MTVHTRLLVLLGVLALSAPTPARAAAPDGPAAWTYFRLLVGRPTTTPGETAILVVPGTVVVPGESAEQRAANILKVIDQLKDAYRLGAVEPAGSTVVSLTQGETKDVPSVPGGPSIRATLVSTDEKSATYRVSLAEGAKTLAEPTIRVERGSRAIVGSRDGEAAPYLFLVVEPLPPEPPHAKTAAPGEKAPVSEPKIIKKVNPVYPAEAKQAKLEGLVLLEATVDTTGRVKDVKTIRGEPMGLTEAAAAAVRQWEFEPAKNAAGRPVEVQFTVTLRFALQ